MGEIRGDRETDHDKWEVGLRRGRGRRRRSGARRRWTGLGEIGERDWRASCGDEKAVSWREREK